MAHVFALERQVIRTKTGEVREESATPSYQHSLTYRPFFCEHEAALGYSVSRG